MRDNRTITQLFRTLWDDVDEGQNFFLQKPLLAHYTSLTVLEKIVDNNEMWFGNPLFMNDSEEIRFGIDEGTNALLRSPEVNDALGSRAQLFRDYLVNSHYRFFNEHAFDTYILCLSNHEEGNSDGILSMWRGYGDGGNGVAIVFDARNHTPVGDTPLIVSKVVYASREQRLQWFAELAKKFAATFVSVDVQPDEMPIAVGALFDRLRAFAIFTKHNGFDEEKEWRLAYFPERDHRKLLSPYLSYFNGPRGIEPKLKLPIQPIPELDPAAIIELGSMVNSIILGPTISSELSRLSVRRMLEALKRPDLADKVIASKIPYRPFK